MISECTLFEIKAQGKTKRSSEKNLKDAIALWIEGCIENGTLENFLDEREFSHLMIGNKETWVYTGSEDATVGELDFRANLTVRNVSIKPIEKKTETIPNQIAWLLQTTYSGQRPSSKVA